jgi:hypothetical protein
VKNNYLSQEKSKKFENPATVKADNKSFEIEVGTSQYSIIKKRVNYHRLAIPTT